MYDIIFGKTKFQQNNYSMFEIMYIETMFPCSGTTYGRTESWTLAK